MSWFRRQWKGINTRKKKEVPEGIWYQCPECKTTVSVKEHEEYLKTCQDCDFHARYLPDEYFALLFDDQVCDIYFEDVLPVDFLKFTDQKSYNDRIEEAYKKSSATDAIQVASGLVSGHDMVVAAMNFAFIGGSMGSVVGERIARAVDLCIEQRKPLLIISQSGGARMMESAFSLMQMAKTSAKLAQLGHAQLPFISLMTHPTTGGVTASFAMLGDINLAEPKALIGFAGPRVIKETIKRDLPEGFQRSEFLLEKGFLDVIVHRKDMKKKLARLLSLLNY